MTFIISDCQAMEEDEVQGLKPFFVLGVLGSTGSCAFDNLLELGSVIASHPGIWFHVDAAYAGSSFLCPEFRPLMAGIDYVHSFNTNPNKWLLTSFDCSCLWVKDRKKLMAGLVVSLSWLLIVRLQIKQYRDLQFKNGSSPGNCKNPDQACQSSEENIESLVDMTFYFENVQGQLCPMMACFCKLEI